MNGVPAETERILDKLTGEVANTADLQIGAHEPGAKPFAGGLDDLRFYDRALSGSEIKTAAIDYPVQAILSGVGGKPSKEEEERLRDYYLRFLAPEYFRRLYSELKADREKLAELDKQILTTMVMSEIEKKRRPTYILGRGDYRNKLEEVTPGVPSVLPPIRTASPRARQRRRPPAGMSSLHRTLRWTWMTMPVRRRPRQRTWKRLRPTRATPSQTVWTLPTGSWIPAIR